MRLARLRRTVPPGVRRRLRRLVYGPPVPQVNTDLTLDDVAETGLEHQRLPELRGGVIGFGPVRVMSVDPPVFLCGIPYDQFQGLAPAFGKRYPGRPAGFLVVPTWSIETPELAATIARTYRWHQDRHPAHRLRYLCNSPGEARLLQERGVPSELLNHKLTVSDDVFCPLPGVPVEFDAIYNARFVDGKRHWLAAQVPTVAYVTYAESHEGRQREFADLAPRYLRPGHVLVNELVDELPVRLPHADVNRALARASTGLLLSEVEGASYAAVEYLLSGLPVVSTPSVGGRDAFFDPEFCLVCEPTPGAVRAAVAELIARQVPREYVRQRTLDKVEEQRQRLLERVDDLRADLGSERLGPRPWPFGDVSGLPWGSFNRHLADFEAADGVELAREVGLPDDALADVRLTVHELRPVIEAVTARPGGSLLVFGAGTDSRLWEHVNAGGTTAIVEHDPGRATRARARLSSARARLLEDRTRTAQWPALLDRPGDLVLDLPDEVRSRRWDVVLVDGPPGHTDALPGRMSSIYEAARLVAPGGRVFVHDVERPAEAAFAARYLGDGRCVLTARGRATLKGYAF